MRISIFLIVIVVVGLSCTSEIEYPQAFPLVVTDSVTNISYTGADFAAHMLKTTPDITSYGFEWIGGVTPFIEGRVEFSGVPDAGAFTYTATRDMGTGDYSVKAFVKTSQLTVYGARVKFYSLGSSPPKILSFTPVEGFDGTEVTLSVGNLTYDPAKTEVLLGGNKVTIISGSDTEVKVKIPFSNMIGAYTLTIRANTGRVALSDIAFKVLGPAITAIPKTTGRVGERITITGEHFDSTPVVSASFISRLDNIPINLVSKVLSPTQMDVYVPDRINSTGNFRIKSTLPGSPEKMSELFENFTITNSWNIIGTSTPVGDANGYDAVTIGELIYVVGDNKLYTFNPVTKEWLQKATFPGTARTLGTAFAHAGKLYYGFGKKTSTATYFKDVWMYDPSNNQWAFVMDAPVAERINPVAVAIDNDVYIGFGVKDTASPTHYNQLWKFNPVAKTWTATTTPFADGVLTDRIAAFAVEGKAYVYHTTSGFWQFNPATSQWTQKTTVTLPSYSANPAVSTGVTGLLFSGSSGVAANKVFEYDPAIDQWTPRQTITSSGRSGEVAVFANGKVYYGLGINSGSFAPDFWELTLKN